MEQDDKAKQHLQPPNKKIQSKSFKSFFLCTESTVVSFTNTKAKLIGSAEVQKQCIKIIVLCLAINAIAR